MDIHLLPGAVVAAAGANPKQVSRSTHEDGSFHQALSQAVGKPDPIKQAATQFEALIIGQVLKAARESSDKGWLGTGDDKTSDMAMEMAEQGLAQGLAAQGGLGIAKMVTSHLRHDEAKLASSGPATRSPQVQPSTDSVHPAPPPRQP
jgi:Rod binding domain-containing protein